MSVNFSYKVGNYSDKGMVRDVNQDSFASAKNSWGELYVVADGMGGHKGGEVASQLAVDYIRTAFKAANSDIIPTDFLTNTIISANKVVQSKAEGNSELEGMGTTVVCIIIKDGQAHIAHVGDSRLYIFRHGKPYFITKDHSLVQELIDAGKLTESEAENDPRKNRISQAVGLGTIECAVLSKTLYKDDIILLCSDGLTNEVGVNEIWDVLGSNEPMASCERLIDLANENGGKDNITAIAIKVTDGPNPPKILPGLKATKINYLVLGAVLGIIVTIGVVITLKVFYPNLGDGDEFVLPPPDIEDLDEDLFMEDSSDVPESIDSSVNKIVVPELDSTNVEPSSLQNKSDSLTVTKSVQGDTSNLDENNK